MKVFLQYRNYKKIHNNFQTLVAGPPEGVEYTLPKVKKKNKFSFWLYKKFSDNKLIQWFIRLYQKHVFESDLTEEFMKEYELIHFVDMIPNKAINLPYVVDVGHIISLSNYHKPSKVEAGVIIGSLASMFCKGVICRTIASRDSIKRFLNDYANESDANIIETKLTVIYPTKEANISEVDLKKRLSKLKEKEVLDLLFVGNGVYAKGAHELIEAVAKLNKDWHRFDLKIVASDYGLLQKRYGKEKFVKYYEPNFSWDEILERFYRNADIYIMLSHHEIFGMVYLDAMSCGVPCLGLNQYSTSEIISNGNNGRTFESSNLVFNNNPYPSRRNFDVDNFVQAETQVVEEVAEYLEVLYKDRELLLGMSRNALETVRHGQFTKETRNRKLRKMYGLNE